MAGQEGKVLDAPTSPAPTQTMAGQDAPKSPAPAPAGGDTGRDHLKLPLAADQDPDATVPQVGSGDEEQEKLVRGKKKNMDDPSGSDASGSTKKPRAADLSHAATVQDAAASTGLAPTLFPAYAFLSQQPFAAAAGVRPPPRRPPGTTAPHSSPAGAAIFFGPMTEEQDRLSKLMDDQDFVLRAAISGNWRPTEAPVLPPNDASCLKMCIKCNTNPATAVSLPSEHICLCHACYEECLVDPLKTPCKHCFAAAAAQIKFH